MTSRRPQTFKVSWCRAANTPINISSLLQSMSVQRSKTRLELCRPGLRYGPSPIRRESSDRRTWLDRFIARRLTDHERRRYTEVDSSKWLSDMMLRKKMLTKLTVSQLDDNRTALVQQLRQTEQNDDILDDALAHALIAVETTQHLVPRANQCLAARAMLNGHCVELATGEGKTLSIALAAGAAALSGTPVHVLTANDYLASRDASNLRAVYQFLGLQVTSVGPNQEAAERRQSYTADIVYVTAKQVAFDWLNDTLESGTKPDSLFAKLSELKQMFSPCADSPLLRGLCLAIVDEADSLLVDEARIPLVLAATQHRAIAEDSEAIIALGLAGQLRESIDYTIRSAARRVQLTDSGRSQLTTLAQKVADVWRSSRYREERVEQALTALHQFERDRDYIVRDGRLELIDAHTGRAMPDRRLPHGLHRLLELKEKCTPSPQQQTIASVPFQHFFNRYIGLVGISGTLFDVASEIHRVYDRLVVLVPPHVPSRRIDLQPLAFMDRSSQLQAMIDDARRRLEMEQPVLVCTRSVEQSLGVSAMLNAHGLSHQVLNAYQDAEEAAIVANAGKATQLTVATNMAGRGTDIPLGATVAQLGGLHVISLAFNDARRLDRQLAGRAARQGDPGSFQQLFSLDDPYLIEAMPAAIRPIARTCVERGLQRAAMLLIRYAQRRMEWKQRKERLVLYQSRERLEHQLAFGGKTERTS